MNREIKIILFSLLIFFLLVFWGCSSIFSGSDSSSNSYSSTSSKVSVGEQGRLYVRGGGVVILARTEYVHNEMVKSAVANDNVGYSQPLLTGDAFSVASNTKVLVIDSSTGARKVRVLEGTHINEVGWVSYEWVVNVNNIA